MTQSPVKQDQVGETVRDNLIAARALIDTPEKFEAMGLSWSRAIYEATNGWDGYYEAERAVSLQGVRGTGHSSIMYRFDRAIAAQVQS